MNVLLIVACLVATPPSGLLRKPPVNRSPPQPLQVVGVSHFPPMVIIGDGDISGSDFDMFEEIARGFGWQRGKDYEYKVLPSFHQLMGELEDGSVQIGLAGISVTHERLLLMRFSQPYMDSGQRILIPPTKPRWTFTTYFGRFWRPEIAMPLVTLLVCWLVFGFLFWLIEQKIKLRAAASKKEPNIKTIGDGTEAAFDIGTTIGFGRFFPTTRIGQWVLAVSCFFCSNLLIGDVYSTLTVNKVEKLDNAITSPADLKGKVVAGVKNTTSVRVAKEYSPVSVIETGTFYEAVVEMRLGNAVAVVADEPVVLHYVKDHPDHAMATGVKFHPEDYGIAFAISGDPLCTVDLVDKFSLAIAKLRENGKLSFIENHWFGE